MTSPAARVIADEAWAGLPWAGLPWAGLPWAGLLWAGLPWAGLKLEAAGFGNADSYYPQSGSTRMTEACALPKPRT